MAHKFDKRNILAIVGEKKIAAVSMKWGREIYDRHSGLGCDFNCKSRGFIVEWKILNNLHRKLSKRVVESYSREKLFFILSLFANSICNKEDSLHNLCILFKAKSGRFKKFHWKIYLDVKSWDFDLSYLHAAIILRVSKMFDLISWEAFQKL